MDLQTKIEIIQCYYQSSNSPTAAIRLYKKRHGIHNDPFDSSAVQRIVKKFEEIGCVAHQAQGAGRPSFSDGRKESVLEALQDASNSNELRLSSVSAVSQLSNIPRSSVYRILRYKLNKYPYRLQMKQELSPDDFVKRETFAKWFLDIMLDSLDNVLWSDECYLDLQGGVKSELKARICSATEEISNSGCLEGAVHNVIDRLQMVITNEGRHIEHVM